MRRFDLGMSIDYCKQWGVVEAIREFAQNAVDAQTVNPDNKMYFDYNKDEQVLRIGNKDGLLTTTSLLLGKTTKENDEKTIGQHGEGYKVATVVLLREGKQVRVYNRSVKEVWTAKMVKSRRYKADVVVFDIEKVSIFKSVPNHDLIFEVEGITEDEYDAIVRSNLHLQDLKEDKDYLQAGMSRVLIDEKFAGRLYVGGLFVTSSKYATLGYDFEPSLIRLDRDRSFIDGLDLQFITGKVLCQTGKIDFIKAAKEHWDGKYIRWYLDDFLKKDDLSSLYEDSFNKFTSKHGVDAIPTNSTDEFNQLKRNGFNAVMVNDNDYHYITHSSSYTAPEVKTETNDELADRLRDWFYDNIVEDSVEYQTGVDIIEDVIACLRQ